MTLIVSALAAGAVATGAGAAEGLSAAAKDAITGLYRRLTSAITGRAGASDMGAQRILDKHAENPAGYQTTLEDLIADSGAAEDPQILTLAKELLKAAKDAGGSGSYTVTQTANASGTSTVNQAGRDQRISGS